MIIEISLCRKVIEKPRIETPSRISVSVLSLDAQEASYNAGQYSGQKKKQYCVQNNMLNVKNNTAATSLLNFDDQSLVKKKKT